MRNIARTVAIVGMLASGPAWSHDFWKNGDPVPAWVSLSCCGPKDVHHLTPEQVHPVVGGWRIDNYDGPGILTSSGDAYPIPYDKALPSQDGEFWGFWVDASIHELNGSVHAGRILCFFAPPPGL